MRARHILLALAAILLVLPASSCGPDWPTAVFTKHFGPDEPYAAYAAGRLGVPQPGYRARNLVLAYLYLTGHAPSAAAQKQATAVNKAFTPQWSGSSDTPSKPGLDQWLAARRSFGKVDGYLPTQILTDHDFPGQQYNSFSNCLDPAFTTAAQTLQQRVATYGGPANPEVIEWVRGQDAVFSNCGSFHQNNYGGEKLTPPPPATMPHPVSHASLWLQQDRAYQQAAATFYSMDYWAAFQHFQSIAADTTSPWSTISRYLTARCFIRQAQLGDTSSSPDDPARKAAAFTKSQSTLLEARRQLLLMRSEPRMASMIPQIDALIDYVNSSLQPQQQALVLAARLQDPHRTDFGQSLTDLTLIRMAELPETDGDPEPPQRIADRKAARDASKNRNAVDLLDWMDTLQHNNRAHALARWQSTHSKPWLFAALALAQPNDASTPQLIDAANNIPANDPAFAAFSYHRLRLSPQTPGRRTQLLALLPSIDAHQGPSARNLFAALNAATAPDFTTWLSQAGRTPAAEDDEGDEENTPGLSANEDIYPNKPKPTPKTPYFTADAATILNTRLPLHLLVDAARSSALAPSLRCQIAQAAWTRAVLLDRPEVARQLSPILIAAHDAWKPVLDAYDRASTPGDRKAAVLFALMRFASTEPNVREGYSRPDGFATYSEFRDNWWDNTIPLPDSDLPKFEGYADITTFAHTAIPDPPFLTPEDRKLASAEIAALKIIPAAGDYLSAQALAWQKAHPHDPRSPELLGQAFRVSRNTNDGAEHQLFLVLHHQYPTSPWTLRYKSWQ